MGIVQIKCILIVFNTCSHTFSEFWPLKENSEIHVCVFVNVMYVPATWSHIHVFFINPSVTCVVWNDSQNFRAKLDCGWNWVFEKINLHMICRYVLCYIAMCNKRGKIIHKRKEHVYHYPRAAQVGIAEEQYTNHHEPHRHLDWRWTGTGHGELTSGENTRTPGGEVQEGRPRGWEGVLIIELGLHVHLYPLFKNIVQ